MATTPAAPSSSSSSTPAVVSEKEQQQIINGFQELREKQQKALQEISKLQTECREHSTVLKTIQTLDPNRKCFRQVGDTLIEFTAEELVVILEETVKKFKQRIEELEQQVVKIGEEINAYKETHNIRLLSNKEAMELQKKQTLAQISKLELGNGTGGGGGGPPAKSAKT